MKTISKAGFFLSCIAALNIAFAESIDPQTLTWSTCGSCPQAPEVVAGGDTVRVGTIGTPENGTQNESRHFAAAQLPAAQSYTITFTYNLATWDSYNAPGSPNPPFNGGTGFWDLFSVSIGSRPYWQSVYSDPLTPAQLPGLKFQWGGSSYGDENIQTRSGTKTVTIKGNTQNPSYLNIGLDTATDPSSDQSFPSYGTFKITSIEATGASDDIPKIAGIPDYNQCGNPFKTGDWWSKTYDATQANICDLGCALSAFAMVLSHQGYEYNPLTLNKRLTDVKGFAAGGNIDFDIVSYLTDKKLEYKKASGAITHLIDSDLKSGRPVIIETDGNGHFVVAIGKTNGIYDIRDPGRINVTKLSYYNNEITSIRRFVPKGSGSFVAYASPGTEILVTDSLGRRVGFVNGGIVNEIIEADYGTAEIKDDNLTSGTDLSIPPHRVVFIPSPPEGFYEISATSISGGPATVEVYRYNLNNQPQTEQILEFDLNPGETVTREVPYSTRQGDLNGDGFVDEEDVLVVLDSLGTVLGDSQFNPVADLNIDEKVNLDDYQIVVSEIPNADFDMDGILDSVDSCLNSDTSASVTIGGCDSKVSNTVDTDGCSLSDILSKCELELRNHGDYVSCSSHLFNEWKSEGTITGRQKGKLQSCAAKSGFGKPSKNLK